MVVSPAKRKWKGSERGTDPGGVVAASAEIEGGRGARGSQKGVKGDERGLPRAPRGRGSFIPGSRLATSSRISPSRSPATCHLPPASTEPPPPRLYPFISLSLSAVAEPLILPISCRCCYCCCNHHRSLFPSPSWHLREDCFRTRPS